MMPIQNFSLGFWAHKTNGTQWDARSLAHNVHPHPAGSEKAPMGCLNCAIPYIRIFTGPLQILREGTRPPKTLDITTDLLF